MAVEVKRRRGTTAQHATFTGALAELTVDTDKKTVVVHDGSTAGGWALPTLTGTETFTNKTVGLVSGAVGSPSLYLNGETTSGLYRIGANNHGWSVSGAKVLDIASTGLGVTGNATVSSKVAVGGASVVNYINHRLSNTFTSGGASTFAVGTQIDGTLTGASGDGLLLHAYVFPNGTVTAGAGEVHSLIASARFDEPAITLTGADTATVASTVYIASAPTEGSTNAALYVASGATILAGDVRVGPSAAVAALTTGSNAWGDGDIKAESDIYAGMSAVSHSGTDANASFFQILRSLGTGASPSAVGSSTYIGSVTWAGYDGVNPAYRTAADIAALVDGTVSSTVVPGRMRLRTANTSGTLTTRLEINSSGSVAISGTGPHAIGGATAASSQLILRGSFTATGSTATGLELGNTMTVDANASAFGLYVATTLVEAASGTHADFASALITPPSITGGAATLTNASTLKITGAPTGATNNYALWVAGGSVRMDGTGPHAIGGATNSSRQLYLTGTFAPAGDAAALYVDTTITAVAGSDNYLHFLGGTINRAGSGTHANLYGVRVPALSIGAGAATITNAATFYIGGAPTAATNNYSLWCSGNTRWDSGYLKVSSSTAYLSLSGAYNELNQNADAANAALYIRHTAVTATNQYGAQIILTGDPNDASRWFISCVGNATDRLVLRSNGGLANYSANDVNLSDATVKRDKGATADHTAFVKALSYRKFSYLDDQTESDIDGLMAQDVQALDPSLVTEFSEGKLGIYTHRLQERINSVIPSMLQRIEALEATIH